MATYPAIQGCEFERVDEDPSRDIGQAIGCAICSQLSYGRATISRDSEGFTIVVAGHCPKYDMYPQAQQAE